MATCGARVRPLLLIGSARSSMLANRLRVRPNARPEIIQHAAPPPRGRYRTPAHRSAAPAPGRRASLVASPRSVRVPKINSASPTSLLSAPNARSFSAKMASRTLTTPADS